MQALDHEGRNALWYAKSSRSNECVELLKLHGCAENPTLPRGGGGAAGRRGQAPPPPAPKDPLPAPPLPPGNEAFEKLPASVI